LFLTELAVSDFELLRTHLMPFQLRAGESLYSAGDDIDNVIFPHSGVVSLNIPLREDAGTGAILVGCDGMIGGFAAVAAAPASCDAQVQIAGEASRMSASAFRYVLDQSPAIRRLAARFDAAVLAQAQQTALCNAAHPVDARICRSLLEIQDRVGDNRVPLTQATLSQLLGVRRTTVTLMAGRLEAAGVLNCRRGAIQIVSRNELQRRSCGCYACLKNYTAGLFAAVEPAAPMPMSRVMDEGREAV
jgi:CRP-like cAMP-binding protein